MEYKTQTSKNKINEKNKPNKNKHVDTENRVVVTEGKGQGRAKWLKRVNCMVMYGNQTFGGGHAIVYSEVELKCGTHEIYIML